MTTEEKLREYILTKYRSLREFSQDINMPYSTINTILNKGIQGASVLKIIKICQALDISTDALAEGKIVPVKRPEVEQTRIEDLIMDLKQKLLNADHLTLDSKPASELEIMQIINALDAAVDAAKRNRITAAYFTKLKEGGLYE